MPLALSSIWKALDMRGTTKVKENFCFLCPCTSSNILEKKVGETIVKDALEKVLHIADTLK